MKYKKFGKLNWDVSKLSLGVIQRPVLIEEKSTAKNMDEADLIRYAIEKGINFLDVGFPYPAGNFAAQIKQLACALKDGYRKKIKISLTLPAVCIESGQDFDKLLNRQLEMLDLEKADFCLLGGLSRYTWPKIKEFGALPWAEKAVTDGRIDHLGFSFHDDFRYLRSICDEYPNWALCRMQYSFMDDKHHPGTVGVEFAAGRGIPAVVSEPLRWGRLTRHIPEPVQRIWEGAAKYSPAEWGMRWVWNNPGVTTVVSCLDSLEQIDEMTAICESAEPDSLSINELVMMSNVKDTYRAMRRIACTGCRCCLVVPCPADIDVERIIELYNDAIMYNDWETAKYLYRIEQHRLEECLECGSCEKTCPRRFHLLRLLSDAQRQFNS